ncbi:MAG: methylenetetrahydrofolate reductase [Microbacteriaceae bacterium]
MNLNCNLQTADKLLVTASVFSSEAAISSIKNILREGKSKAKPTLSFEYFPPKDDAGAESLFRSFDSLMELSPDFVSVTYGAGGSNRARSLSVVERMAPHVPTIGHLTCVGASKASSLEIIRTFEDVGVAAILAIRGDAPKDAPEALAHGELKTALDLVELAASASSLDIGVGAFPEVHPESPDMDHDVRVLKLKAEAGASFAVTQLFFKVETYFDLLARCVAAGIEMPIVPGLMPISNAKQVLRMAQMSGAEVPTKLVSKLEDASDEDSRRIGMDFTIDFGRQLLEAGAPGLHIFTLNHSVAATEVARGTGLA